jgi:hypothetical protein
MDKQQKKAARIRIGTLLDENCDKCPKKLSSQTTTKQRENTCKGCPVFSELTYLGKVIDQKTTDKKEGKLVPVGSAFHMPFEEYFKLKDQGLLDKDIAARKGVTKSNFANWKFKNRLRISEFKKNLDKKKREEKAKLANAFELEKPKALPSIYQDTSDWEQKYAQLEIDYKDLVVKAGEMERDFKNEIDSLKRKLKASESSHIEVDQTQDEIEDLKAHINLLELKISSKEDFIENLQNELSSIRLEAKAMRDLLRIKL